MKASRGRTVGRVGQPASSKGRAPKASGGNVKGAAKVPFKSGRKGGGHTGAGGK